VPSCVVSTGSSAVQILRASVLSSRITECKVVPTKDACRR
jgi:hypothetical protein